MIGFIILVSMKKNMEIKLALLNRSMESTKGAAKPIVWWIVLSTVWGIVSIFLIVWMFHFAV
nr:hypothetical protein [Salipaludibacillus sp. CUR1]